MLHNFLANNRDDLIARCKEKVARRPRRAATSEQLSNGIPMFLDQLRRTLEAEANLMTVESLAISGAAGGDIAARSEIGVTAAAHGRDLLKLGFSINQVVHDYGDLCQAITDLAYERNAPFAVEEFRTLNRCLDTAIADAVSEFSREREASTALLHYAEVNQRMGFLVHELRNHLGTAILAVSALQQGNLPIGGATGEVLKRSLAGMKRMTDNALSEVIRKDALVSQRASVNLAALLADTKQSAALSAREKSCSLTVTDTDPSIGITVNRELIQGALANLLQNAFKFTCPGTEVLLSAHTVGNHVSIEVADHCGGLPAGDSEAMFKPFTQRGGDKSGLGLGLTIARQAVESDGGTLTVRNLPGTGCVFAVTLPWHRIDAGRSLN